MSKTAVRQSARLYARPSLYMSVISGRTLQKKGDRHQYHHEDPGKKRHGNTQGNQLRQRADVLLVKFGRHSLKPVNKRIKKTGPRHYNRRGKKNQKRPDRKRSINIAKQIDPLIHQKRKKQNKQLGGQEPADKLFEHTLTYKMIFIHYTGTKEKMKYWKI